MPREPVALFVITESRSQPGWVSIRPYPPPKLGTVTLQTHLTEAGFKPGDVVELRIHHGTRIRADQLPPPGMLAKRPRRRRVKP